jgi:hypothetical protein
MERVKPYLAPYYLAVAAVLGAITVGFGIVFVLLGLVTPFLSAHSVVE